MRATILFAVLLAAASIGARADAAVHHHNGASSAASIVSVAVVQLPGGASIQSGIATSMAQLGTVSGNAHPTVPGVEILRRARSYVVVTEIGLEASSQSVPGPVSLQAFLDAPLSGAMLRIDGVEIGSSPVTFGTRVPLGSVTRHRLELEIPYTLNPSLVPSEIPLEFGATPQ